MSLWIAKAVDKGAYLQQSGGSWTLTHNTSLAHKTTKDKLINITTCNMKRFGYTWEFEEIADPIERPVYASTWMATQDYADTLAAIHKLTALASSTHINQMQNDLTELNNQMVDLEHYAEFSAIDKDIGYSIALKMQDIMKHRRALKQQLQLTAKIHQCKDVKELLDGRFDSEATDNVPKMYTQRSANLKLDWEGIANE